MVFVQVIVIDSDKVVLFIIVLNIYGNFQFRELGCVFVFDYVVDDIFQYYIKSVGIKVFVRDLYFDVRLFELAFDEVIDVNVFNDIIGEVVFDDRLLMEIFEYIIIELLCIGIDWFIGGNISEQRGLGV